MKKMRNRTVPLVLIGLLLWSNSPKAQTDSTTTTPAVQRPVRALWIVRDALTSRGKVHTAVEEAAAGGITDLLVQVRGRGDAYYNGTLEPRASEIEAKPSFDPLAVVLEQAHASGLKVHAWVAVNLIASATTLPSSHPTSSGSLSGRSPRQLGWRRRPSEVRSL